MFTDPSVEGSWFDMRWLSGDWQDEITGGGMIAESGSDLCFKDHIQPLPSLYPSSSKQSPLSSDLRNVTLHAGSITLKLPNPMHDLSCFTMADTIFTIAEATVLISSDLPASFLVGEVATENSSHGFPHDPSDISCIPNSATISCYSL